jgi:hypothetical protein
MWLKRDSVIFDVNNQTNADYCALITGLPFDEETFSISDVKNYFNGIDISCSGNASTRKILDQLKLNNEKEKIEVSEVLLL